MKAVNHLDSTNMRSVCACVGQNQNRFKGAEEGREEQLKRIDKIRLQNSRDGYGTWKTKQQQSHIWLKPGSGWDLEACKRCHNMYCWLLLLSGELHLCQAKSNKTGWKHKISVQEHVHVWIMSTDQRLQVQHVGPDLSADGDALAAGIVAILLFQDRKKSSSTAVLKVGMDDMA